MEKIEVMQRIVEARTNIQNIKESFLLYDKKMEECVIAYHFVGEIDGIPYEIASEVTSPNEYTIWEKNLEEGEEAPWIFVCQVTHEECWNIILGQIEEESNIKALIVMKSDFIRDAQYYHGTDLEADHDAEEWHDLEGELIIEQGEYKDEATIEERIQYLAKYYEVPSERLKYYLLTENNYA